LDPSRGLIERRRKKPEKETSHYVRKDRNRKEEEGTT
jgi:hypothetical protein